jgi:membrane fusion protein
MSLFREEVSDYRKARLHGEVVLTQPLSTRLMVGALLVVILVIGAWVLLGSYSRIETAPGILITDEPSAKIIAPVPGIVTELRVKEGTLVKQGDQIAIINLDRRATSGAQVAGEGIEAIDSRRAIGKDQIALTAQQMAAERTRINTVISSATAQAGNLEMQLALQKEVVASNQQLFDQIEKVMEKGFISRVEYERRRQLLIGSKQTLAGLEQQLLGKRSEAAEARAQLASLTVQSARNVTDIQASLQGLSQQRAQLEGEQAYIVSAPISGRVTALQIAPGRTASPNVPIMIIVPEGSTLRAELYAPSRAIGFVHPGQETRLLFDAFPYQRFGSFEGRIQSVSRTIIDPRESDIAIKLEEPVYRVTVKLDRQAVEAYGEQVPLQPGMTLQANIILERQSFLDWLLKPLNAVLKRTA